MGTVRSCTPRLREGRRLIHPVVRLLLSPGERGQGAERDDRGYGCVARRMMVLGVVGREEAEPRTSLSTGTVDQDAFWWGRWARATHEGSSRE